MTVRKARVLNRTPLGFDAPPSLSNLSPSLHCTEYATWLTSNPKPPPSTTAATVVTPGTLTIPPNRVKKIIKLDPTLRPFTREVRSLQPRGVSPQRGYKGVFMLWETAFDVIHLWPLRPRY